jgi:putative transposase
MMRSLPYSVLLRREGFAINRKKSHRIYVEERLQVRKRKKRRRCAITRKPLVLPSRPGQRWSMDFMSDQLSSGRRIRLFNVIVNRGAILVHGNG